MKAENAKITEKRGLEQSGILPGINSIQAVAKFQVNKFFDAFARVSDQISDSLLDHKEARLLTKKEKINAQLEAIRLRRLSEGDNRQAKHKSTVNLYELSDRQKA